ncbi:hypothetical protein L873DRAFT_1655219, partial [Choiromyces venosus 120613-1]
QLLVHGLHTSDSLATIAIELTTFNSGLALTQQLRWLTSDESHAGKSASSITITITGLKASLFVNKQLSNFSTNFRTKRCLQFNTFTQCSNCHHFGHHSNKCTGPSSCHWCTLPHSTGDHSYPTLTCHLQGHPCTHFTPRCVNCDDLHESHSNAC